MLFICFFDVKLRRGPRVYAFFCFQWKNAAFILPSHYQRGRPGTASHSASALSPRFPVWCLSGRCCGCGNCAHSCLKNKVRRRETPYMKPHYLSWVESFKPDVPDVHFSPWPPLTLILLYSNCDKDIWHCVLTSVWQCECGNIMRINSVWLTGDSNVTVGLPFIYHIHHFLGARDKSLRAALSQRQTRANTHLCGEENKQTSIQTFTDKKTVPANEHFHYAHPFCTDIFNSHKDDKNIVCVKQRRYKS